jgi:hypothetical protein
MGLPKQDFSCGWYDRSVIPGLYVFSFRKYETVGGGRSIDAEFVEAHQL